MNFSKETFESNIKRFIRPIETVLSSEYTIEEALGKLREKPLKEKILYFYVVDPEGKLVGILPTRKFLLSYPSTKIKDVMDKSYVFVEDSCSVEKAMELFVEKRLMALPVIDSAGKLQGVIDVYFCIKEGFQADGNTVTQDIFQMVGLSLEQKQGQKASHGFRMRMPWLLFNIVGGLTCAAISDYYENVLAKFLMLAMFIPLVLTLSESISMQAMTVSLHSLHSRDKGVRPVIMRLFHELRTVIFLGLVCGSGVGIASLFWGGGWHPSSLIAISICVSMCASALFGAVLPILLHTMRLDPKLAAGPIVLMLADIFTTFVYLSLSTWWLLKVVPSVAS